jgi:hypothetical protein
VCKAGTETRKTQQFLELISSSLGLVSFFSLMNRVEEPAPEENFNAIIQVAHLR